MADDSSYTYPTPLPVTEADSAAVPEPSQGREAEQADPGAVLSVESVVESILKSTKDRPKKKPKSSIYSSLHQKLLALVSEHNISYDFSPNARRISHPGLVWCRTSRAYIGKHTKQKKKANFRKLCEGCRSGHCVGIRLAVGEDE